MPVSPDELRNAMRQWASGVAVIAVEYQGVRHGMTVSSFTSLSLEPPLVMVSLERGSRTHSLLEQSGYFGVTILCSDQRAVSQRFAGGVPDGHDRFVGLQTFTLASGAPLLSDGLSFFDCKVVSTYKAGTHTVFIGEVLAVQEITSGRPLLYYNRAYMELCE
jgi:flavin reductase (DIM6/NTAB) family NADH-FMN oxidoreductase RutF